MTSIRVERVVTRLSENYMSSTNVTQAPSGGWRGLLYPTLWAAFVALLVTGPWLMPGYLFGTDWPGQRRFLFPTELSSSGLIQVVLGTTSHLFPGEIVGKVFVVGLLFLGALGAYCTVPVAGFVPKAVAATLYLANPFV